jgi:uncharacterized damage-inducible protein DinB
MTERVDVAPVAGLDVQTGLLLAMLDDNTADWRGELGEVSDDAVLWQPFPHAHSIGALILHIADVEANWLHEIGAGQTRSEEELSRLLSQETQQYQIIWPTPPAHPLSWFLAQHNEIRARTRQIVSAWDDPALVRPAHNVEFTRRWLLHHVLTHEAYHGGQAVLLSILHGRQG